MKLKNPYELNTIRARRDYTNWIFGNFRLHQYGIQMLGLDGVLVSCVSFIATVVKWTPSRAVVTALRSLYTTTRIHDWYYIWNEVDEILIKLVVKGLRHMRRYAWAISCRFTAPNYKCNSYTFPNLRPKLWPTLSRVSRDHYTPTFDAALVHF